MTEPSRSAASKPPQQFAFAQKMLLPDELLERRRPHPRRQRLRLLPILSFGGGEEGRHVIRSIVAVNSDSPIIL